MRMFTVHQPTEADHDFFQWTVSGELIVVPGICPWNERTTMLMVREVHVREDDLISACLNTFGNSGHDDETFGEPLESLAREVASDAIEAASKYPLGTLLMLVQGRDDAGHWNYLLERADAVTHV
ncbi:hypothetical protein A5659_03635 [Mycobacterium sp. 1165196.3]|nr:hypothetical protein A5659_03635 [Mycobacterium sp. 1165196.3]